MDLIKQLEEKINNVHWHFVFYATDQEIGLTMSTLDISEIYIDHAETEQEALEIAKNKVVRKNYRLKKAWQCDRCAKAQDHAELVQLTKEYMKKHTEEHG